MIFLIPELDASSRPYGTGRCSICNSHGQPGDRAVRLGEPIEMEGFFDICEQCAREVSKTIGWVAPEALASSQEEAAALAASLQEWQDAHAAQQDTIDSLARELGIAAQRVADARAMYQQTVAAPTVATVEPDFGAGPLTPLVPGA